MNQLTTPTANAILANQSANLRNLEMLQKHFPSAIEVTPDGRYTVNAAQLQRALDPAGVKIEEDGFELRWVGKREAYNTAFTPAQNILEPLPLESKNWDSTGNLLLRGDNLDALRLLRHSYFGKVKLIYIDPPYNTQSDAFIYNDNFGVNQTQILENLGYDKDNIEYIKNIYGARTHSGWLSFMYPRLLLAKDLLRDDGVIFISIDDNEQAQLKLLCDEVFGQSNFVAMFPWRKRTAKSDVPFGVSQDFEWVICYAKDDYMAGNALEREYYETPDFPNDKWRLSDLTAPKTAEERPNSAFEMRDPKTNKPYPFNPKRIWGVSEDTFQGWYDKGKIVFPDDYDFLKIKSPAYRVFESEDKAKALKKYGSEAAIKAVSTLLPKEVGLSENGNKDLSALFKDKLFSFPKPVALLQYLIGSATDEQNDDLILDFFAGSGTTGEAVMRLNAEDGGNRRFILVQIPQAIDPKKQKEAHKFVTEELGKPATIFEITAERLRRAGEKILASQAVSDKASQTGTAAAPVDIGFRVFEVAPDLDALIFQKPLSEATQADLAHFEAAAIAASPGQQALRQDRVLHNLLLAEGLPLTTRITEVLAGRLYLAADVAIFLGAVNGIELADTLAALKASDAPPVYLTIYAPWITDDNFLQNIKTQAESLGFSGDKLRMRG